MRAVNWERWARAGGIGFVVFAVAAFVVGGEPPKIGDPAADIVAYFDGERSQVLASSFLDVLAAIPSAVFFLAASMGLMRTRMIPP